MLLVLRQRKFSTALGFSMQTLSLKEGKRAEGEEQAGTGQRKEEKVFQLRGSTHESNPSEVIHRETKEDIQHH